MRKSKRKNKTKEISIYLIGILLLIILLLICGKYEELQELLGIEIQETPRINKVTAEEFQNVELNGDDLLKIYFFDVGQADSILIVNKNETMLIDAGNNDDGDLVVNNIKKLGISKLNYVIGTHPHEDHIGGLDIVIEKLEVENVWMPKIQTNTKTFEDVLDSISKKGLKVKQPEVGTKVNIGDAICEVMLCDSKIAEEQNNLNLASIVIRLTYGEQSYLFMGDAETENERTRSWPQTNVLKVGHHGSNTSSGNNFLKQVMPQIAIIEVGKDNSYGHPKETTINKLNKIGTIIYRTDEKGNILIKSDGIKNNVELVTFFSDIK